jgi:hypothetical protein
VAAHALGRRVAVSDQSPVAIATARARLLRDRAAVTIERAPHAAVAPARAVDVSVLEATAEMVAVTLREPAEPMAWAVGTIDGDVFHCAWHAERGLGARAASAERAAVVPRESAMFVRVWGDDGSISTAPIAIDARRPIAAAEPK